MLSALGTLRTCRGSAGCPLPVVKQTYLGRQPMSPSDPERPSTAPNATRADAFGLPRSSIKPVGWGSREQRADMRRRRFLGVLGGIASALPFGVRALQAARAPTIGFLG